MNLGQTLLAVLALTLLLTIAVNINKARLGAVAATIEQMVDQEAINFAQSILEDYSRKAITEEGYLDMSSTTTTLTFDSGRVLYADIEVSDYTDYTHEIDEIQEGKQVIVSIYAEEDEGEYSDLRARNSATFYTWWK